MQKNAHFDDTSVQRSRQLGFVLTAVGVILAHEKCFENKFDVCRDLGFIS